MDVNYSVQIEDFAKRHFIKSFYKKYKARWDITLKAIIAEFERIDNLLLTDKAEIICNVNGTEIIKTEFKIAGTKESAKTSGNRCIIAWHKDRQHVSILLVYSKTDISGKNETAKWKGIIKNNYPEYKTIT